MSAGDHQRVDLGQGGVLGGEGAVEGGHELDGGAEEVAGEGGGEGELAAQVGLEAGEGIDEGLVDLLRRGGGHLLDVDAAGLAGHDHRAAAAAVDHDAQIELALGLDLLLDQHPLDDAPLGAGLVGDQAHADDLAGGVLGLGGRVGQLDAAALAAAAGVDLGLDHHRHAQLLGDLAGLLGRGGDAPLGDGHAELGHDLLGLVLVDLHGFSLGSRVSGPWVKVVADAVLANGVRSTAAILL